jgi:hypothetical protein
MLQNRVNPEGQIIKTSARGAWMGNRGQLHDSGQQVLRQFKLKAWLICLLEFKDRKRPVMAPNRYTELFFLDEATAYAAGHRPCFECRRADYERFKSYWIKRNPENGFNEKTSIKLIDAILQSERINANGDKLTYEDKIANLPDGTFIRLQNEGYLLYKQQVYRWTPFGYEAGKSFSGAERVTVLTPKSTVNAFKAGLLPQMNLRNQLQI